MEKETVSYSELARRVGDMVLANNLRTETETEDIGFWECVNGSDAWDYCDNHGEYNHDCAECVKISDSGAYDSKDIYQEYIITEGGAAYLQRKTNEIVFYNEKLDLYLWGITHFGTSWDDVYTEIKDN